MIYLHFDSSALPDMEVDEDEFNDIWEEIETYGDAEQNYTNEKSYIMMEARKDGDFLSKMGIDGWYDFPRVVAAPFEKGKWGVIVNDDPEKVMATRELKTLVKDFFDGKYKEPERGDTT